MIQEKDIIVEHQACYATYGNLSAETKNIWVVFHGYGQLAKYFIRRFDILDPSQHFVIAPQGLSKFYVKGLFGAVGASWMTKEKRTIDIDNQQIYLNTIFHQETQSVDWNQVKLHIFGFSQGVATACRWIFRQQLTIDRLIMWAGEFPPDIHEQLTLKPTAQILALVGNQDPFYSLEKWKTQLERIEKYAQKPDIHIFEGKHEVSRDVLRSFV